MGILSLFSGESDPTPAPRASDAGGLLTKVAGEQLPTAAEYLSTLLQERVSEVPEGKIATTRMGSPSYMDFLLGDVRHEFALPPVELRDDRDFEITNPPLGMGYYEMRDAESRAYDKSNVGELANILRQIEAIPSENRTPQMGSLMLDIPNYLRIRTGF